MLRELYGKEAATTSSEKIKAITVYPIWAWAIMARHKKTENRSWSVNYRGPLAIHAGINRASETADRALFRRLKIEVPEDLPEGVILGLVDLTGCDAIGRGDARDPFAEGPYLWRLENPRLFRQPIVARGRQALWTATLPAGLLTRSNVFRIDLPGPTRRPRS